MAHWLFFPTDPQFIMLFCYNVLLISLIFSAALEKGGVGALELVAMEMKARLNFIFLTWKNEQ
jgi:hypothetical protein